MQNSKIQWTEATWNPLAGCTEVSPGCQNCYAAVMAKRLEAMGQAKYASTTKTLPNGKVVWTGKINMDDDNALTVPFRRKKPTMYFVNSMSDLFHEDVPDYFIDKVFGMMGLCDEERRGHTFQVLTKRAERMRDYMNSRGHQAWNSHRLGTETYPPRNVWLGVSVEDRARLQRIDHLRQTPAALRFVSVEPLLEDLGHDFGRALLKPRIHGSDAPPAISLVICGGESGPNARPFNLLWAMNLLKQCRSANVAFFMKQCGSRPVFGNPLAVPVIMKDKKGGDPAEWPENLRVRELPEVRARS